MVSTIETQYLSTVKTNFIALLETPLILLGMTQAERIIKRFSGAYALAEMIGYTPAAVYKWTYPKAKGGTGGLVPTGAVPKILAAAKRERIRILLEDWVP